MIDVHIKKRDLNLTIAIVIMITAFLIIIVSYPSPTTNRPPSPLMILVYPLTYGILPFWFKGFYHWSKAKGYSGILGFFSAMMGFPLGFIVLGCLADKTMEA